MVDLAPGVAAQVVVVLGCQPKGRRCDSADALGALRSVQPAPLVAWCALGALHALPAFGIVRSSSLPQPVLGEKHVAQPRTYTLNKKDVKMLGTAVIKKAPRV